MSITLEEKLQAYLKKKNLGLVAKAVSTRSGSCCCSSRTVNIVQVLSTSPNGGAKLLEKGGYTKQIVDDIPLYLQDGLLFDDEVTFTLNSFLGIKFFEFTGIGVPEVASSCAC